MKNFMNGFIIGVLVMGICAILIVRNTPSQSTDEAHWGTMPRYIIVDANRLEIK